MSRNLLHVSKLQEFMKWCNERGLEAKEHSQVGYMVATVKPKSCKLQHGYGIWRRDKMPEHLTVDRRLEPVVRIFIKETREKSSDMGAAGAVPDERSAQS